MDFNLRLKELRKVNKVTQIQTATACNLAERAYQRLESKDNKPAYDTLISLADYFNVSLDYLVGRSDNPERR